MKIEQDNLERPENIQLYEKLSKLNFKKRDCQCNLNDFEMKYKSIPNNIRSTKFELKILIFIFSLIILVLILLIAFLLFNSSHLILREILRQYKLYALFYIVLIIYLELNLLKRIVSSYIMLSSKKNEMLRNLFHLQATKSFYDKEEFYKHKIQEVNNDIELFDIEIRKVEKKLQQLNLEAKNKKILPLEEKKSEQKEGLSLNWESQKESIDEDWFEYMENDKKALMQLISESKVQINYLKDKISKTQNKYNQIKKNIFFAVLIFLLTILFEGLIPVQFRFIYMIIQTIGLFIVIMTMYRNYKYPVLDYLIEIESSLVSDS